MGNRKWQKPDKNLSSSITIRFFKITAWFIAWYERFSTARNYDLTIYLDIYLHSTWEYHFVQK